MTRPTFLKYLPSKKTLFFCTLLFCVLIRYWVADIAFERDEGEYAYAGTTILDGGIPYKDVYNMKLPGVYYFYALLFKCFGKTVFGIRLGLIFINLLSTYLVFLLAKKIFNPNTGFYAATAFLMFNLSFYAQGICANCEHFLILFMLAAMVLIADKKGSSTFLAGLFFSLAVLMKQHAIFFLIFAYIWLLISTLSNDKPNSPKQKFLAILKNYTILTASFLIPILGLTLYMINKGIIKQFLFLTYHYAASYASLNKFSIVNLKNFEMIFKDNLGYWLICFVTLFWIVKDLVSRFRKDSDKTSPLKSPEFTLLLFWICSFLSTTPGYYFRPHYFLLLSPASALIVGYGLEYRIKQKQNATLLNTLSVVSACCVPLFFFNISKPETISNQIYHSEKINELTRNLCDTLIKYNKNKGTMGMLGFEPQAFFYTKMKSASGYMYEFPMSEKQPYAMTMAKQFIDEIKNAQPDILWEQPIISDGKAASEKYLRQEWNKIQDSTHYKPIIRIYRRQAEPDDIDTMIVGTQKLAGDWFPIFTVSEKLKN
jgi:hypothetical protein